MGKNSVVNGFIKSAKVSLAATAAVNGNIDYSAVTLSLPTAYVNTSVTNGLSNSSVADNYNGTLNGDFKTLVIGKGARVTLAGKVFGKIIVAEGAEVNFTSTDVSIDQLSVENGKLTPTKACITTVSFASNSIIRVKNKVSFGSYNQVNAAGSTFYVANGKKDEEKFTINGGNTTVNANVYITDGSLVVKGTDASRPCTLNGEFISEYIISDAFVNWNRNNCNYFAPRVARPTQKPLKEIEGFNVYPNPGFGIFNVAVKTMTGGTAQVVVLNESGNQVFSQNFSNIRTGQSLPVNLVNQPAGIYIVKVVTAEGIQTAKLVKAK